MPPDYETLREHSDATRDIGREAQRWGQLLRTHSWHGRSTEQPRASDIARPGGFRRFFLSADVEPLMQTVLRVQQEGVARLASPLLPFYAAQTESKRLSASPTSKDVHRF